MEWVFVGKDTEQSKAELTDHRETSDSLDTCTSTEIRFGSEKEKREKSGSE